MKRMSRKEQAALLGAAGIHNDYNITQDGHPFYSYGACHKLSGWTLRVKGREITGPWQHNGARWFPCRGVEERKRKKQEALDWIQRHFPGMEMAPSPFFRMSFVPKQDLEEALRAAQEADQRVA